MRIISQDKTIDVPYDNVVLIIEPTSFNTGISSRIPPLL